MDTGSEISIISDMVINRLKENTRATIPTLPVAGVSIVGLIVILSK